MAPLFTVLRDCVFGSFHSMPARKSRAASEKPAGGKSRAQTGENLTGVVADNVKRLRSDLDLSLDKLANLSGVSKAMLSQIEQSRSAPSINVLWKIARALDVPFAALISKRTDAQLQVVRRNEMKILSSQKGGFVSRASFPLDIPRRVEFYELEMSQGCVEKAVAHPPGTAENIVVAEGQIEIEINGQKNLLEQGDSIFFVADQPHVYRNLAKGTSRAYLVMTYAEKRV